LKERLKELRKALRLTQTEFAERIGSVQNTITGYESGRRNPSNPVIASICKEFNVNEEWLREGKGEMFAPSITGPLDALVQQYGLNASDSALIEKFVEMSAPKRAAIIEYILSAAAALGADPVATSQQSPAPLDFDSLSIEEKVNLYREKLEKEAETNEGLKGGDGASSAAS